MPVLSRKLQRTYRSWKTTSSQSNIPSLLQTWKTQLEMKDFSTTRGSRMHFSRRLRDGKGHRTKICTEPPTNYSWIWTSISGRRKTTNLQESITSSRRSRRPNRRKMTWTSTTAISEATTQINSTINNINEI